MAKSKPNGKPYPDFPLTPHRSSNQWCKKVRGKVFYFGKLDDWQAALAKWNEEKDYLLAGMEPPSRSDGIDVGELCNRFLAWKRELMQSGELAAVTYDDYKIDCKCIIKVLGRNRVVDSLTPSDFGKLRDARAAEVAISTMQPFVGRVRHVFTWGNENELCEQPKFGRMFDAPTQRALKRHRHRQGQWTFNRDEIIEILDTAKPQLRAMVMLGINAGYNPSDIAYLEFRHLQDDWLRDFPRVKTGEDRKAWLWPETLNAVREYLAIRHEPKDSQFSDRVFVTPRCSPYGNSRDAQDIGALLRRHLRKIGLYRPRVSFKLLRDTFATEADQTGDMRAVSVVMGHVQSDMTGHYVKRFDDDRIKRVCQHVRSWLFGGADE